MTFAYVVRDALGRSLEGTIDADSPEDATQKLQQDGFQVLKLDERREEFALFKRRVTSAEIIYMTNQLAIMTDTGITLAAALEGIAEQAENPTLQTVLNDLKHKVESGDDFSSALSNHPRLFDQTYVALVRAGEETGALSEMLDQIASYMRKDAENRSKVRSALTYPAVMLVLAIGVTIFLLTFILPKFAPLFTKKGIKLPTPTLIMMTASDLLLNYWYAWLAGAVGAIIAYIVAQRTTAGRQVLDYIKINLPLLGGMFRKVIISRSLRTLGTMVASGVQVLDAIQRTADVSANYYYEQAWQKVIHDVTNGSRICESLSGSPLFPTTLVQMIGAGEETGKLDSVLAKVSGHYEGEVETSLKTVTSLIEPMMITVMGVVVGGIGMALMLPIFSLSRGM